MYCTGRCSAQYWFRQEYGCNYIVLCELAFSIINASTLINIQQWLSMRIIHSHNSFFHVNLSVSFVLFFFMFYLYRVPKLDHYLLYYSYIDKSRKHIYIYIYVILYVMYIYISYIVNVTSCWMNNFIDYAGSYCAFLRDSRHLTLTCNSELTN